LTQRQWSWALLALILGFFTALVFLIGIYARLVELKAEGFPSTGDASWYVVLAYIAMVGIVAGVAEEAGYRGYMQVELEQAYGPIVAVTISSAVFALAHWSIVLLPFFFFVGAILGAVAYLARSIVPGVFVHAAYDSMMIILAWQFGYPRVERLDPGAVDQPFIIACTLAALALTGSLWAMTALAHERRAVAAAVQRRLSPRS
jgi:membrane protease YdiL (CAAX protease family)